MFTEHSHDTEPGNSTILNAPEPNDVCECGHLFKEHDGHQGEFSTQCLHGYEFAIGSEHCHCSGFMRPVFDNLI